VGRNKYMCIGDWLLTNYPTLAIIVRHATKRERERERVERERERERGKLSLSWLRLNTP